MPHLSPAPLVVVPITVVRDAVRGTTFLRPNSDGVAPVRLPEWTRHQHPAIGVTLVSEEASGVRLALRTAASVLELTLEIESLVRGEVTMIGRAATFVSVVEGQQTDRVDLIDRGVRIRLTAQGPVRSDGEALTVSLALGGNADRERSVEIWLPQTAAVTVLEMRADAVVHVDPPDDSVRWLHYGSSISHGIDADGPLGTWPAVAARSLGWNLTNLGLSGQAVLDPFVARTIRDLEADIITLKVGINIVGGDVFRERTFVPALHGFLDTIRDGHPTTPIVVFSSVLSSAHETTPGPSVMGSHGHFIGPSAEQRPEALTLVRMRQLTRDAVASRKDAALDYIDGLELLGEADAARLHDGVHPDHEGLALMGARFAQLMKSRDSPS